MAWPWAKTPLKTTVQCFAVRRALSPSLPPVLLTLSCHTDIHSFIRPSRSICMLASGYRNEVQPWGNADNGEGARKGLEQTDHH